MNRKTLLLLFAISVCYSALAQTREIYVNPNFTELAKHHSKIAVLPFKTIIKLRPKQMEKMTPEQFDKLQNDEGLAVQSAVLSYFLKRKEQHDLNVSVLDVNTTNALLKKNNINNENIDSFTPAELCTLLGVDAVLSGLFQTDKPMSDGASLALFMVVGFAGPTNSGSVTININDGKTGELLWKYDKTLSRSLGSDTNTIIKTMMRKASRKLPYITEGESDSD
jgi:hypothetical protein